MRILAICKYPPIQGGTSSRCYSALHALASAGHSVTVVTNAAQAEDAYRVALFPPDVGFLNRSYPSGGSVEMLSTGAVPVAGQYVPRGDSFTSRLAAIAIRAAETARPDVIFASYLEPYGTAALLTANAIGIPYVLEHAGSDRTRLLAHPELHAALRQVVRQASVIFNSDRSLVGLGVDPAKITRTMPSLLPEGAFTPKGPTLLEGDVASFVPAPPPGFFERPVVGIYGKVGVAKGSFALVKALEELRVRGVEFSFAAMTGGSRHADFEEGIRNAGLEDVTWKLPFLAPWRVPEFLRCCDLVCFLEHDFPVKIHGPKVPREVLAVGRTLVLSEEIRAKQLRPSELVDGETAFIIADPSAGNELAEKLASALGDATARSEVARKGHLLYDLVAPAPVVQGYEEAFERAIEEHNGGAIREATFEESLTPALRRALRTVLKHFVPPASASLIGGFESLTDEIWGAKDSLPAWLWDVCAYELCEAWLRIILPGEHLPVASTYTCDASGDDIFLLPTSLLRFETFGHDVVTLRDLELAESAAPKRRPSTYLFAKTFDLYGVVYRCDPRFSTLGEILGGGASLTDVLASLEIDEQSARLFLQRLLTSGALSIGGDGQR